MRSACSLLSASLISINGSFLVKSAVVIGVLLSLSEALITKAYLPIMALGIIAGLIIGVIMWAVVGT